MLSTFGQRFLDLAQTRGSLCVGIDPHAGLLDSWGLSATAEGLDAFSRICVEAMSETVAVVKPQVAFYERFGSAGFAVLERTIADLRAAGVLVIADAKRGDIGSTMEGYANAWLAEGSPLESDAVTLSPYLGFGSLEPALDLADRLGKGAIVLAATSNPEAATVQRAVVGAQSSAHEDAAAEATPESGECSLSQHIVDEVARRNARTMEATGAAAGNVGVVIGATLDDAPILENVGGMILMPGVGTQGGSMADVRRLAGKAFHLASPNVSRTVLKEGPRVEDLVAAIEKAQQSLQMG